MTWEELETGEGKMEVYKIVRNLEITMKNLNRSKDVKKKRTPPKQSAQAGFNTLSKEFPGPGRWLSGYEHLPPSLMP